MNKEWYVSEDGTTISSADFTHDVILIVNGDFADNTQRKAYAEKLAEKLNGTQQEQTLCAVIFEGEACLNEYGLSLPEGSLLYTANEAERE